MEKLVLANKTELELEAGASLSRNVVIVQDFNSLKALAELLTQEENLKTVQYKSEEIMTGNYTDMRLVKPMFSSVDYAEDGKVKAAFSIREKTEEEKRLDTLEEHMEVTEGAVQEIILGK